MASFTLGLSATLNTEAAEDDWMLPEAGQKASINTSTPIYAPPVQTSGAVQKAVATPARAAVPAWTTPDAPASLKLSGRVGRLSNAQKIEYDRNTAKALAAAQAASRAAEQSVKLAAMAQKQAAQTAAQMAVQSKPSKAVAAPKPPLQSPVTDMVLENKEDKEDKEDKVVKVDKDKADMEVKEVDPPAEEAEADHADGEGVETEGPPSKKPRGVKDTFAGYRPPKTALKLEEFNLKKELYHSSREELKKRFPGKDILIARTAKQQEYWTFVRDNLAKRFPKSKKKGSPKPSQQEVRDAISQASEKWRLRLEKSLSGGSGGSSS